MRLLTSGLNGQVPAVEMIYPNPIITPEMAAAMRAATGLDGTGRGNGMGCGCGGGCGDSGNGMGCVTDMICEGAANSGMPMRGRDVSYAIVGLNGVGDFAPASFPVPQNPIVAGLAGFGQNGIGNALAGLRGLNAFDLSSMQNFVTSAETGSSTLLGVTLPNWAWLLGGAAIVAAMAGGRARGRH